MLNVNEKDFRYYSMPIHNPLFKQRRICHRGDVVRWTFTVEKPEVIANIVPEPLVYNDNKLHIDINVLKEMVSGFPEGFQLWIEMGIKMQVTFKGEPKTYLCELYANNINVLFIDREFFECQEFRGVYPLKETETIPNSHFRIMKAIEICSMFLSNHFLKIHHLRDHHLEEKVKSLLN